jgi:hypothetical protein
MSTKTKTPAEIREQIAQLKKLLGETPASLGEVDNDGALVLSLKGIRPERHFRKWFSVMYAPETVEFVQTLLKNEEIQDYTKK